MPDARDIVALNELRALRGRVDDAAARARTARVDIDDGEEDAIERRARLDGVCQALAFVDKWITEGVVRAETAPVGVLETP